MLEKLFDLLGGEFIKALLNRRHIRVLVHRAFFDNDQEEYFFINVTNLSQKRDIEITHIWFNSNPKVHVIRDDRKLPKRLRPDETWETWIAVNQLPLSYHAYGFTMVRVRLSTGSVAYSKRNTTLPERGEVPGGPVNRG